MITLTDLILIKDDKKEVKLFKNGYQNFSTPSEDNDILYTDFSLFINANNIRKVKIIGIYEIARIKLVFEMFAIIDSSNDIYPFFVKFIDMNDKINIFWKELVMINNINIITKSDDVFYKDSSIFNNIHQRPEVSSIYDFLIPNNYDELRKYRKSRSYKDFTKLYLQEPNYNIKFLVEEILYQNSNNNLYMFGSKSWANKTTKESNLFKNLEYILFNMDKSWSYEIMRKFKIEIENIDMINDMIKHKLFANSLIRYPISDIKLDYAGRDYNSSLLTSLVICQNLTLFPVTDFDIIINDIINNCNINATYMYHPLVINTYDKIKYNQFQMMFNVLRTSLLEIINEFNYNKSNAKINVRILKNYKEKVKIMFYVENERYPYIHEFDLFFIPLICDGISFIF